MWHWIKVGVLIIAWMMGEASSRVAGADSATLCDSDPQAIELPVGWKTNVKAKFNGWEHFDPNIVAELSKAKQIWLGTEVLRVDSEPEEFEKFQTLWWIDANGECQMQTILKPQATS